MLLDHVDGLMSYYRFLKRKYLLLRRGRGYKDLDYLLLKAQRVVATKTELVSTTTALHGPRHRSLRLRPNELGSLPRISALHRTNLAGSGFVLMSPLVSPAPNLKWLSLT